jgi:L-arabinonolactonase
MILPAQSSAANAANATLPAWRGGQGHCLRWDAAAAQWCWADRAGGTYQAWSIDQQLALHSFLPDEAGPFVHCASGRLLVCQPKRLCLTMTTRVPGVPRQRAWSLRLLVMVDPAEPRTSIHEGHNDRAGNFVFGTRNDAVDARPIGSFYQYSRRFGLRRLALPAVTVGTSICFSGDGRRMYFADGCRPLIFQCDYDAAGAQVANVRPFATLGAMPESAVIDRDGHLWSAQAALGSLLRFRPDGTLAGSLPLPAGSLAGMAFGGANLDQLAVSSARGLFRITDSGAAGVAELPFDDG